MKQDRKIDFTGQEIYVGIDVHKKSWKVGIELRNISQKPFHQEVDVNRLLKHLRRHYPGGIYKVAYEAGFSGYWLQEALRLSGVSCEIFNAADIPTSDKERKFKTDKRDCRKIAKALKNKDLKGISIPSKQLQYDRMLVRGRYTIKKDESRIKNRIWSLIHFYGYAFNVEGYWSKKTIEELKQIGATKEDSTLLLYIKQLEQTRELLLESNRAIRKLSKTVRYKEQLELIRSVPGIGLLTGMLFLTEIDDINNYKSLDNLCGIFGLTPNTDNSAEVERIGGLTKRGRTRLRTALIESSWVSIRHDLELASCYQSYCKRMKSSKAIVKIARKLLNRIRYVLKNQQKYEKATD